MNPFLIWNSLLKKIVQTLVELKRSVKNNKKSRGIPQLLSIGRRDGSFRGAWRSQQRITEKTL